MKPPAVYRLCLLGLAALLIGAVVAPAQAEAPAAAIEAAYLYKFAPFVTWPADSGGPFRLCVVGEDPFGPVIDRVVTGQTLGGRPIQLVRLDEIDHQSGCYIAFIGGSRRQSVAAALREVRGAPVLTVTDEDDTPGIIAFAIADGHVRFRIDQAQAQQNGLSISSKLLGLALSVHTANG
ncbi:MAG: YfiR family protein, partial [Asticcacaulis sp.]